MSQSDRRETTAFLLVTSASPDLRALSDRLRAFPEVQETAILYGQYDIVAILRGVSEGRAHEVASDVATWPQVNFALVEVASDDSGFQRAPRSARADRGVPTEAFLEMSVDSVQRDAVLRQLEGLAEVTEARPVSDNRVLCWLFGASKPAIDQAVMEQLRGVRGVFATSTYLVVGEPNSAYRWSRGAGTRA